MNMGYILVAALVGALIGWITNILAIKLIFRPYVPINILGIRLQGLIPKQRHELAKAIGQTVENDLLSSEEILGKITSPTIQDKMLNEIKEKIRLKVTGLLPSFLPNSLKEHLLQMVNNIIIGEVVDFLNDSFPKIANNLKDAIPISDMVENKINQLDIRELENLVLRIAKEELKHIEYLGGILGFIIGLIQGSFFVLLTL